LNKDKEYFFREGCFITEWHNTPNDEDQSIARVRVEVGVTTRLHSLQSTAERYVILEGAGVATVGSDEIEVSVGDVVVIPSNCPQKIKNTGPEDLIFLAICTPRFKEENYQDLQQD